MKRISGGGGGISHDKRLFDFENRVESSAKSEFMFYVYSNRFILRYFILLNNVSKNSQSEALSGRNCNYTTTTHHSPQHIFLLRPLCFFLNTIVEYDQRFNYRFKFIDFSLMIVLDIRRICIKKMNTQENVCK